jgi:hypothetical protein
MEFDFLGTTILLSTIEDILTLKWNIRTYREEDNDDDRGGDDDDDDDDDNHQ